MSDWAHVLRENRSRSLQRHWIFFDVEAYREHPSPIRETHRYRLAVATYLRLGDDRDPQRMDGEICATEEALARFIAGHALSKTTLHVVAHNVGYDLQVSGLLERLVEDGWVPTSIYAKGMTVNIALERGTKRIVFQDGMNRLRGKIADWGKVLGREKLEVDFDQADDAELARYCQRDVEILRDAHLAFFRFVAKHDLGHLANTISAQALAAYTHRFMPHEIHIHKDLEATALERQAYRGGMVRTFRVGTYEGERFTQLDVNSMYGYVMLRGQYPTRLLAKRTDLSLADLGRLLERYAVIAEVDVHPGVPYLAYEHEGHVTYPCCEFRTALTTSELAIALRRGEIRAVHRANVYRKRHIFADYVQFFWGLRQAAIANDDGVSKAMCKQFLNSLYGKFGAYRGGFSRYPDLDGMMPRVDRIRLEGEPLPRLVFYLNDLAYVEDRGGEAYNSFPAIAAEVTAKARLYLFHLACRAGLRNVYYSDTDSLIVNDAGRQALQDLIQPDQLGKLKVEAEADELRIGCRKVYRIGEKMVCKGANLAYLTGEHPEYARDCWQTLNTYLRSGFQKKFHIRYTPLQMKFTIYDGWVDSEGRVNPFTELPETWEGHRQAGSNILDADESDPFADF